MEKSECEFSKEKKDFLLATALSSSRGAAFQRSNVYSMDSPQAYKDNFIVEFNKKLTSLESTYSVAISEEVHIRNIELFRSELSAQFPRVLNNESMRFGIAQKAVNLYLKFLWVLGYIPEPPHCPIDRIILQNVGIKDKNWTHLDKKEDYMEMIEKIRFVAKETGLTIAEWELKFWNEKN